VLVVVVTAVVETADESSAGDAASDVPVHPMSEKAATTPTALANKAGRVELALTVGNTKRTLRAWTRLEQPLAGLSQLLDT